VDTLKIKELMCSVDQFPRISSQANFYEAILALETAEQDFGDGKAGQCVLLVEDKDGKIVGKISPMDAIRGLEPKYDKIESLTDTIRYGVPQVVESMKDDYRLWQEPLKDLCRKAVNIKVENLLSQPGKTESVKLTESINSALHLFATTRHHYLFVMEDESIIGVLLLADVYKAICNIVKACEI
jgi:predicted transcriptional regulator